jgi:hypothetical protein
MFLSVNGRCALCGVAWIKKDVYARLVRNRAYPGQTANGVPLDPQIGTDLYMLTPLVITPHIGGGP